MAKIILKNLTLEIPLIGATRLFQKKIDAENFSEKNIGSSKILKDNKMEDMADYKIKLYQS